MSDFDAHVERDFDTQQGKDDGTVERGGGPGREPGMWGVVDWSRMSKREQAGEADE